MSEMQFNTRIEPVAVPGASGGAARAPVIGGSASVAALAAASSSALAQAQTRVQAARTAQGAVSDDLEKRLQDAMQSLNQQLAHSGRSLGFTYDPSIASSVVRVIDQSSGALIRQIPAQAVVDVAHSIDALKGLIFSQHT